MSGAEGGIKTCAGALSVTQRTRQVKVPNAQRLMIDSPCMVSGCVWSDFV